MVSVWSIVTTEWQQVVLGLMANLGRNGVDVGISVDRHKLLVQPISMMGACLGAFSTMGVWFCSHSQNFFIYDARRGKAIWKYSSTHRYAPACSRMLPHRLKSCNFWATFSRLNSDRSGIPTNEAKLLARPFFVVNSLHEWKQKQDKSWSKNYAKFDQQRNRKKQEENVYYSSRVIN